MKSLIILAAMTFALAKPGTVYTGTVTKVTDGDTVQVTVKAWAKTPFDPVDLRIVGIDTPETRMPPAKCAAEVVRGKAASAFAKTIIHVGDVVKFKYASVDKYGGRLDASIRLPDGRDYATVMLVGGYARIYNGGTKSDWCNGQP